MKFFSLAFIVVSLPSEVFGTHLQGGYISVTSVSHSSLTYKITVRAFVAGGSAVKFGGDESYLYFGDGEREFVPESPAVMINAHTGLAEFTTYHTYNSPRQYKVSYSEPNRSPFVNFNESINTPFYLETRFVIDPALPSYSSAQLLTLPIFIAPMQTDYAYGITAVDAGDNRIVYKVSSPVGSGANYTLPENFIVNPFDGLVTWDTKFQNSYVAGDYLFNIKIHQFHGEILLGTMTLEFMIRIEDENDELFLTHNLDLDENNRIYIPSGESESFKVFFENSQITPLAFGVYTELDGSIVSFSSYDSTFENRSLRVGSVAITNDPSIERINPYLLTIRGVSTGYDTLQKDVAFMIFTKDVDVQDIPIVVGMYERKDEQFIYPNPFEQAIRVKGFGDRTFRLVIYDLNGLIVFNKQLNEEEEIYLQALPDGLYLYRILDGIHSLSGKLTKR